MIIHAHNELGASPTIAVHGSRLSGVILNTIYRGPGGIIALYLLNEDIELGGGGVPVGDGHFTSVGGLRTKLSVHMVSSVGSTYGGRVLPGLSLDCELARAHASRGHREPGEGLEVQPHLAHVAVHLIYSEFACF